jgi:PAS domain S-box-containing protein
MKTIRLICYAAMLFLMLSSSAMSAENRQKILCLHSYDPSYEWQKSMDTAIDRTLLNAAPDIEIYHEYMDVLRNPDPAFQVDLFNYLKSKYREISFNVVLATDNNALNFLLNYRDWLMGQVPVVFLGINNYSRYMLRNQPFYTGVAENIDMAETLKTAIHLMPQIRKLVVYGSWNTTFFENVSLLNQAVSGNNLSVEIQLVENISISRILSHASGLEKDTAVIFLSQVLDDDGSLMSITKSIRMISQASPVPVLGFWDFTLGNGALGGKLVSGQSQGETAARIALQILNGENAENIPVIEKSPNRFMFDYVQMKRFSIPLSALSENSLVINQPESFFTRNKTAVLTILSILCSLIAIIGVLSSTIIRRKRAEKLLRDSEGKQRAMIANIFDVIAIIDINGINRYKSPNIEKWFGWRPKDVVGISTWENVHPEDLDRMQIFFGALMGEPNTTGKAECRYRCKDGSFKWIEITAVNLSHVPDIEGVLLNYHDISERKLAEKALIESEDKFRLTFNFSPDSVNINRLHDGLFVDINDGFTRLTGFTRNEVIGKTSSEIGIWNDSADRNKLTQGLLEHGIYENLEAQFRSKDGRLISALMSARVISLRGVRHIISITRDITERKLIEAQLQQAQKMESIGSLAGGIAHDLNNILFPISGLSEMLLDETPPDDPAYENIEQIHKSAQRCGDLVKQILSFSRQSKPQKLHISIQTILKEVLKLARAAIPMNIEIKNHINTDCGMVSADPTQIHQIAMNLITNAYHAVENTGGTIDIALKEVDFEKEEMTLHAIPGDILAGKYVCFTVSDTGTGIDQTLIDKIFDPYFTTKELGKGTGLGLSVVHGIVKEHGGDIRVYSEVEKGTTFHVYLPLLEDAMDSKTATASKKHPTGRERILLVDDEAPIAKMLQVILKKLGYQVTVLTSSTEALEVFRSNPSNFDLVISDKGMPNMTGEQLAGELISIRPGIPIILCTGFSDESDENRAREIGVKGFLKKPVATGDLAEMVRKVLGEA